MARFEMRCEKTPEKGKEGEKRKKRKFISLAHSRVMVQCFISSSASPTVSVLYVGRLLPCPARKGLEGEGREEGGKKGENRLGAAARFSRSNFCFSSMRRPALKGGEKKRGKRELSRAHRTSKKPTTFVPLFAFDRQRSEKDIRRGERGKKEGGGGGGIRTPGRIPFLIHLYPANGRFLTRGDFSDREEEGEKGEDHQFRFWPRNCSFVSDIGLAARYRSRHQRRQLGGEKKREKRGKRETLRINSRKGGNYNSLSVRRLLHRLCPRQHVIRAFPSIVTKWSEGRRKRGGERKKTRHSFILTYCWGKHDFTCLPGDISAVQSTALIDFSFTTVSRSVRRKGGKRKERRLRVEPCDQYGVAN